MGILYLYVGAFINIWSVDHNHVIEIAYHLLRCDFSKWDNITYLFKLINLLFCLFDGLLGLQTG